MIIIPILVGGWPTPLKNMSSSVEIIVPNWMESHKIHVPNDKSVYCCLFFWLYPMISLSLMVKILFWWMIIIPILVGGIPTIVTVTILLTTINHYQPLGQ